MIRRAAKTTSPNLRKLSIRLFTENFTDLKQPVISYRNLVNELTLKINTNILLEG
jgi:hypothetical protein